MHVVYADGIFERSRLCDQGPENREKAKAPTQRGSQVAKPPKRLGNQTVKTLTVWRLRGPLIAKLTLPSTSANNV